MILRISLVKFKIKGYQLTDTIGMIYYNLLDLQISIHHIMASMGFFYALVYDDCGIEVIYGFQLAEISNLSMHARKILQSLRLVYTKLHDLCERWYFFTYMTARVWYTIKGVFLPFLVYRVFFSKYMMVMKISAVLLGI